jgi:radial spoke head protein 4A
LIKLLLIFVKRYDHLAKVLNRLLSERPTDAVDIFEDVSRQEKKEKFVNKVDTLIDKPDRSKEANLAEIQRGLFIVIIYINFL